MRRPPAPNLRSFADPEGPWLTCDQVRATLASAPAPAEQHLTIPFNVVIRDLFADGFTRAERRWLEGDQ